jgi:hypothetical protein
MKCAVRPIHKKDDRSEITNYRPIALISNFAKVFEYVLYNSSLHYVSHKLSPNQHGFTKCRSTETNLVSISPFLKNVVFMLNGAYPPRGCPQGLLLGEVGLQSLLDRRMEHSVIFLFKLFKRLQECPHVLERISLRVSRLGSRVRSVFYIGQRHTDIGLKSPVTRMLRNYQSVEAHIDIFCCSISQIKKFFSISS